MYPKRNKSIDVYHRMKQEQCALGFCITHIPYSINRDSKVYETENICVKGNTKLRTNYIPSAFTVLFLFCTVCTPPAE